MKKLLLINLAILLTVGLGLTVVTCVKETPIANTDKDYNKTILPRTLDTSYVPLLWGSSLRIVPRVIYNGKYNKKNYWFAQTFAYSKITPANYQQDSIRERIVVADSSTIIQTDTFYICRRIIK